MTIEHRPRHYATRLLRAIYRQGPASIITLVATPADALEDQDTLAYATASQMIGELQAPLKAF